VKPIYSSTAIGDNEARGQSLSAGSLRSRVCAGHEGDGLVGMAGCRRSALAMLVWPVKRRRLTTRLRSAAMTCGPLPVRA
jgi:hypothetical protein